MPENEVTLSGTMRGGGKTVGSATKTLSGPRLQVVAKESIAAGATYSTDPEEFKAALADIVAIGWEANQDGSLKTNVLATPGDTFALKKNVATMWEPAMVASGIPNPFTVPITALHVTNLAEPGANSAMTFTLIALLK